DAILLVELPGVRAGRHHRGDLLAVRDGHVSEGLASADDLENRKGPDGEARRHAETFDRRGPERLVALHARVDLHLRRGTPGDESNAHLRVAQAAGSVSAQPGVSG